MFQWIAFLFLCFWRNVYLSAPVPQFLPCPKKFLLVHLYAGNILFAKRWIHLGLNNCSVISTVTLCYVLHQKCLFRYMDIQAYSASSRYIHTYWGIVKAYSAPCVTLTYSQPCHILSTDIFRTGGIFKTLWNFHQAYSEPCHGQNSLFRHFSVIFRTLP